MRDLKRIFSLDREDNYWERKYYKMKEEVRKANKGIRRLERRLKKSKNIKEIENPIIDNKYDYPVDNVYWGD